MEIKVLGTGCPKCKALEKAAQDVIRELGIDATVGKEEDIMKIMGYGIMHTCLLYTSPSPRDRTRYRMPSSA